MIPSFFFTDWNRKIRSTAKLQDQDKGLINV